MAEFAIKVTPRARRVGLKLDGDLIRAYVAAPPEGGSANQELIHLIAKTLDVPRSSVEIVRGEKSRHKIVAITGLSVNAVHGKLGANAKLFK